MIFAGSGCVKQNQATLPPPIDITYSYINCGKIKEKIDLMNEPDIVSCDNIEDVQLIYTYNLIELSDALKRAETIVQCYEKQAGGKEINK